MIEWEYPPDGVLPDPVSVDLNSQEEAMAVYMALANGTIREMRVDGDCDEALAVARGLIRGAGGASPHTVTREEKERLWLYEDGYDAFLQAEDGYIFVNKTAGLDT